MNDRNTQHATVLVVDDDLTNLEVLLHSLSEAGFKILIAENGERALQQAEVAQPDILLLDVLMPGLDGFETCQRLKANDETKDIPVIFMTALSEVVDKVKGFDVGGVDYITKPLQHEEVIARLNTHLTLRDQQRQLETVNVSKNKFFSIIAHDLRGPLNVLREMAQLAEENFENYSLNKLREITILQRKSIDNLCSLLENLLIWTRIQRGMIEYKPQRIDIEYVVMWNVKLLKPDAEKKLITLKISVEKETYVYSDLNMLDTIVRNLISNAIKFTNNNGHIEISAISDQNIVVVSVSDTGIGISEKHLLKLFRIEDKYQRLGTSHEKGTGLGLILCKEFVERNGGKIWCESQIGAGSTFKFTLPKPHEQQP